MLGAGVQEDASHNVHVKSARERCACLAVVKLQTILGSMRAAAGLLVLLECSALACYVHTEPELLYNAQ